MLVFNLYVLTVKPVAYLKKTKTWKIKSKKKENYNFNKKNKKKKNFAHGKLKKPFYSTVQPRPQKQPKIDFPYYENSGSDICSLICGVKPRDVG